MSLSDFLLFALPAVFLTGLSKGGFGGALGGIAVPLLALSTSPTQAAAVMLPILCLADVVGLKAYVGKWDVANLKVMLPMVTIAEEIRQAGLLLDDVMRELKAEGIACARPPLGIMVEVPAVAIAPELYDEAAFFSIGSNDLTQYVMAAARDEPGVSHLNDPTHPAILKLIASVVAFGRDRNIPVSLCGDMASDPRYLRSLLRAGLRSISVAPDAIGRVKAALSEAVLSET